MACMSVSPLLSAGCLLFQLGLDLGGECLDLGQRPARGRAVARGPGLLHLDDHPVQLGGAGRGRIVMPEADVARNAQDQRGRRTILGVAGLGIGRVDHRACQAELLVQFRQLLGKSHDVSYCRTLAMTLNSGPGSRPSNSTATPLRLRTRPMARRPTMGAVSSGS